MVHLVALQDGHLYSRSDVRPCVMYGSASSSSIDRQVHPVKLLISKALIAEPRAAKSPLSLSIFNEVEQDVCVCVCMNMRICPSDGLLVCQRG